MEYNLDFNKNNYTVKTLTLDNQTITYRAYENIVYVKNPVDINFNIMNIFIPEAYYERKSVGNYTAETAPIFFPNTVGGYMPGPPGIPGRNLLDDKINAIFVALLIGVFVMEL